MPSRRKLSLSPRADDDLADTLQYTETRWGAEQADTLQTILLNALLRLADYPRLGRERPELSTGLRSLVVGQYVIYYRILADDTVRVNRIIHTRRDIRAEVIE